MKELIVFNTQHSSSPSKRSPDFFELWEARTRALTVHSSWIEIIPSSLWFIFIFHRQFFAEKLEQVKVIFLSFRKQYRAAWESSQTTLCRLIKKQPNKLSSAPLTTGWDKRKSVGWLSEISASSFIHSPEQPETWCSFSVSSSPKYIQLFHYEILAVINSHFSPVILAIHFLSTSASSRHIRSFNHPSSTLCHRPHLLLVLNPPGERWNVFSMEIHSNWIDCGDNDTKQLSILRDSLSKSSKFSAGMSLTNLSLTPDATRQMIMKFNFFSCVVAAVLRDSAHHIRIILIFSAYHFSRWWW